MMHLLGAFLGGEKNTNDNNKNKIIIVKGRSAALRGWVGASSLPWEWGEISMMVRACLNSAPSR